MFLGDASPKSGQMLKVVGTIPKDSRGENPIKQLFAYTQTTIRLYSN